MQRLLCDLTGHVRPDRHHFLVQFPIKVWHRVVGFAAAAIALFPPLGPCCLRGSDTVAAGGEVFLSKQHLAALKSRVASKTEPTYSAYLKVRQDADAALNRTPSAPETWRVPGFYANHDLHRAAKKPLMDDANDAYALGLTYQMTGDEKYALAAARFINAWAVNVKTLDTKAEDSKLTFNYHFPALVFAADLIKSSPSWPQEEQERFKTFVREKALPMRTTTLPNNWGNWGVLFTMTCATYLGDQALFQNTVQRWKTLLNEQIADDGHLTLEVTRNNGKGDYGIWYSHFSLMPATLSAEIARLHGVDLYSYTSLKGHSLKLAFDTLVPWASHPETFPYYKGPVSGLQNTNAISYWEILDAHFPNAGARTMATSMRPLTDIHSAPYLTFTHGDLPKDQ